MQHESTGVIRTSIERGLLRIALDVDPGIAEVARALIPKHFRVNRPKFAPHISLVRQAEKIDNFDRHEGEVVPFMYSMTIHHDDTYFWLIAESPRLRAIRVELGLPELGWCCRPPDDSDCFHVTVANLK